MKKHVVAFPIIFFAVFVGFFYYQCQHFHKREIQGIHSRLNYSVKLIAQALNDGLNQHVTFINLFADALQEDQDGESTSIVFLKHERAETKNFWCFNPELNIVRSLDETMNHTFFEKHSGIREAIVTCFGDSKTTLFVPHKGSVNPHYLYLLKYASAINQVVVTAFDGTIMINRAVAQNSGEPVFIKLLIDDILFWSKGHEGNPLFEEAQITWLDRHFHFFIHSGNHVCALSSYASIPRKIWIIALILALGLSFFMGYILWMNQKKKDAESKYRHLFENANVGYFLLENLIVTKCNKKLLELIDVPETDILHSKIQVFFKQNKAEWFFTQEDTQDLFLAKGLLRFEVVRKREAQEEQAFRFHLNPMRLGDKDLILCVVSDISSRKKQEKLVRESEKRYRRLIENAPELIFILQDGKIKVPNQQALHVTGFSQQELEKQSLSDLVVEEDLKAFKHEMDSLGEKPAKTSTFSIRIQDNNEKTIWLEIHAHEFTWEGRQAVLNFVRNISQEKSTEGQLFQAKKLEAVGTLAAGIAHDFNNLLQAIQGSVSVLRRKRAEDKPLVESLKAISGHINRGSNLTRQLLGFAKRGQYKVRPVLINDIVERTAIMFARTHRRIRMNYQFQKSLWTVDVDEGQIEQVLLNLFLNADQAMAEGGLITLRTENMSLSTGFRETYDLENQQYVRISVVDTGVGMNESTLARIFEPFFTKKEKKSGTGLGLASAYGIIKNHKGAIEVKSKPGVGSTFNLYLPISTQPFQKLEETTGKIYFGNETVLIVDDEEQVLAMTGEMLEALGYQVILCFSGEKALEIYKQNPDKTDIVLLDMVMPGMNGQDVFHAIKHLEPNQKILLCSGYSEDRVAKDLIDAGAHGFLAKPFDIKQLSERVKEILHPEIFK